MFFTDSVLRKEKPHLKKLDEVASQSRAIIRARMQEVDVVDRQLQQVISETKKLTIGIREKLSTQLKITRKSLRTICSNLQDGVVIVNCDGKIIEINESCEKIFGYPKSSLIGHDLSFLTGKIEDYGDTFKPSMNFFRALSHNILFRLSHGDELNYLDVASYFSGVGPNESIITLINPEKGEQKFSFSFSVLDNEPEELEDITYIGFFKQEPSLDRRASD